MQDGAAPYLCVSAVPAPGLDTVEIGKLPGLLACISVCDEQGQYQVYSYWAGRDCFERRREAFLRALPGAVETLRGPVSHVKAKPKSVWERFPVWTVIVTVAGVIGAIGALWEQGARLFEPPDITVVAKRDNRPNYESPTPPVVGFTVTNQCRFAPAAVEVEFVLARKDGASKPLKGGDRLSRIEPGKSAGFDFSLDLPEPALDAVPPEYEVRVTVTAKAGVWRPDRRFFAAPQTFRYWRPLAWTKPSPRTTAAACSLEGNIYSGEGRKAAGVVIVKTPATVENVITTLPPGKPVTGFLSYGQVWRQELPVTSLAAFQRYPYVIRVNAQGMSREACSALAQAPDLLVLK